MSKRLTKEEIVKRVRKVHGDKYDYSLFLNNDFNYERITDVIPILCPIHGKFEQSLANHLQGKGCSKCNGGVSFSKEEFEERGHLIHNHKYDYSKTDLEHRDEKGRVRIICPIHGEFWQQPRKHLMGQGCHYCSGHDRKTVEELIREIKSIHGDKYGTDKIVYVNNTTDITLTCPIHGDFKLTPHNLLCGKQGCPKCNRSHLETEISLFLEREGIEYEEQKKFPWLKNYRLDFYLPQYNVAIECQGRQHFEAVGQFGGEEQLRIQNEWDDEKKALCDDNGIRVIYFTKGEFKNKNKDYRYKLISRKKELLNEIKKA